MSTSSLLGPWSASFDRGVEFPSYQRRSAPASQLKDLPQPLWLSLTSAPLHLGEVDISVLYCLFHLNLNPQRSGEEESFRFSRNAAGPPATRRNLRMSCCHSTRHDTSDSVKSIVSLGDLAAEMKRGNNGEHCSSLRRSFETCGPPLSCYV